MKRALGMIGSLLLVLTLSAWAYPQGQGKKDQKQTDKKDDKSKNSDKSSDKSSDDAPFGGTLNVQSSQKSADTATLGFKGVGPDGQIDPAKLAENPTAQDETLVMQIQQIAVAGDDLKEFIKDGSLKGR